MQLVTVTGVKVWVTGTVSVKVIKVGMVTVCGTQVTDKSLFEMLPVTVTVTGLELV